MRILVDNGDLYCHNMGDVAMIQVAISRLTKMWPDASIRVFTLDPDSLLAYCPGVQPFISRGRDFWIADRVFLGRYHRFLPERLSMQLSGLKRALGLRWPTLVASLLRLRQNLRGYDGGIITEFTEAMNNTDLLVVCGSGGFTDHCREWNMSVLNTMENVMRHKIPVVLFGQGMGPLNDAMVLTKAKDVLPRVSLITLRGSPGGLSLLESLGVAPFRVLTTGDEAIELAYNARPKEPGHAIGVNMRVSSNSDVEQAHIEKIRPILQTFAREHHAAMLPVPIACHAWARDDETIRRLLAGFDDQSDGGVSLNTPLKVIQQVSRCKIVVTGAYHAAVFALSQGIPVVSLAKSDYFISKFEGLADQFGLGIETVLVNDKDLSEKLAAALERAWESAEGVRQQLQDAALHQIMLSRSAYDLVRDMVNTRRN